MRCFAGLAILLLAATSARAQGAAAPDCVAVPDLTLQCGGNNVTFTGVCPSAVGPR